MEFSSHSSRRRRQQSNLHPNSLHTLNFINSDIMEWILFFWNFSFWEKRTSDLLLCLFWINLFSYRSGEKNVLNLKLFEKISSKNRVHKKLNFKTLLIDNHFYVCFGRNFDGVEKLFSNLMHEIYVDFVCWFEGISIKVNEKLEEICHFSPITQFQNVTVH